MARPRGFDADTALDVAVDLFWRQGFDGTAMQDLCRATNLAPGSLYAAFGDKRALFLAAMRRYMATVSSQAVDRINGAPSGLQGIRDYFAHLVDAMVDGKRQWGCLVTNSVVEFAGADPELAMLLQLHLARLETAFAGALARARAAHELRPRAGPDDAGMLVALVQGMNVLARSRPGRAALAAIPAAAMAGLVATGG